MRKSVFRNNLLLNIMVKSAKMGSYWRIYFISVKILSLLMSNCLDSQSILSLMLKENKSNEKDRTRTLLANTALELVDILHQLSSKEALATIMTKIS